MPDSMCSLVVVGASAGGVEALQRFARALPSDFAAPVLVVLHASPRSRSYLPEILSRSGRLPAVHARDGDRIEGGRIYIAPPDCHLVVADGTLRVVRGPRENGHRPAIDPLFRTAAAEYDSRVAGVVLSGTLDDGTVGLNCIKEAGGATLAQDPDDALYADMPLNAIAYVDPDYVQPVEDLVDTLVRLTASGRLELGRNGAVTAPDDDPLEAAPAPGAEDAQPGEIVSFSCPECGGTLWETESGGTVSYRCRVGHAYTLNNLVARHGDAIERALWTAYRALEERAAMSHRVARRLADRGRPDSSERFERQAEVSERHAAELKSILDGFEPLAAEAAPESRSESRRMAAAAASPEFEELVQYIKENRGFDFGGYKRPSLARRFEKRMQAVGVESYPEYRLYLEHHPDEFVELFNTILINVTAFFRDGPAWDYLRQHVIPELAGQAEEGGDVRIWSTGCASGEEAYSLAMCLAEIMPEHAFRDRVKIYATDVDEEALSEGRHGIYPAAKLEGVPGELRERYFDRVEQRYSVKPDLRRAVVFGRHDVVQDPPISRIDLLTSRNTLMYFTPDAQARILTNFHFALRDRGYLFLGKSEMMLGRSNLFTPVDLKRRVFQRVPRTEGYRPIARAHELRGEAQPGHGEGQLGEVGFESAPIAQLIVDRGGYLTLANMQARTLFNLAQRDVGKPLKDLEVSYRPVELRSQIDRAYAERHAINVRDVAWLHPSGDQRVMDVQVAPLIAGDGKLVGVGISFVDVTRYKRLQEAVEHTKRDVEVAYEELQSTVEELETTNEELQSTNEELETMNEELQSTNEELETMNDELNQRTDELNQTNFFLESILGSLDAGVVVLDDEMRIAAWNEGSYDLWGLRGEEVIGQHFMNLGLPVEKIRTALRRVLAGEPVEQPLEVPATNRRGRSITCRVRLSPLADGGPAARGLIVSMESVET